MRIYRPEDRLEQDERILVISDPDEFRLYRERDKLNLKGILYHSSISQELADAAQQCARSVNLPKTAYRCDQGSFQECNIRNGQIPEAIFAVIGLLTDIFSSAIGMKSKASLRINSDYPNNFHQHKTALTFGILEGGTLCKNQRGEEYNIGNGDILICEDILHRAPPATALWAEQPRTNIVLLQNPLGHLDY